MFLFGHYEGQHHHGVPMQRLLPIVLRANRGDCCSKQPSRGTRTSGRGTDCGFGTFAGFGPVEPDIAYLKLRSLVEGAQLASRRLWS